MPWPTQVAYNGTKGSQKEENTVDGDSTFDLDEDAIARLAEVERIRVFNDRSITGALSSPLGIALLGWILITQAGLGAAVAWIICISLVEVAILLVGLGCRRALEGRGVPKEWLQRHFFLVGISGLIWGSVVWVAWSDGGFVRYLATLTVLVGVAGVSIVTMSSFRTAAGLFFPGIYLVPLLHEIVHPKPASLFISVGLMVVLLVHLWYAYGLGKIVFREVENYARNLVLVERLHELVTHDPLTGAYSRRHIFEQLERSVAARQRHGAAAAVIMFDLDHFKAINDSYGHPAGDRALREVVRVVNSQLRDGDLLGRVGGEEFLVLLPMTDLAAAQRLAERLRETLEVTSIEEGPRSVYLPASFGIAELQSAESYSAWFRRVDAALYEAKSRGRNAVVAAV